MAKHETQWVTCPKCHGNRTVWRRCPQCKNGVVGRNKDGEDITCYTCNGIAEVEDGCGTCGGVGEVQVPA